MHWLQGSASKISLLLTAAILRRLKHGKMMHGIDFYFFLLHTFIPWHMSESRRKSLAKRFSKHGTLWKLVNWYACPSFSASDVPVAEYLQGLTGESRKCGVDLVVAHVTGRKVGGQLETERRESSCRVTAVTVAWPADPSLPRWMGSPGTAFKVSSPGSGRAGTRLFVYHKKAVYVIPHNT